MYGEIIEELRKDRGLTQNELGQLLHVSNSTVAGYECERIAPPIHVLSAMAEIFHVNVDYILGRTKVREPWSDQLGQIDFERRKIPAAEVIACLRSINSGDRDLMIRLIFSMARSKDG